MAQVIAREKSLQNVEDCTSKVHLNVLAGFLCIFIAERLPLIRVRVRVLRDGCGTTPHLMMEQC